MGFRVGLLILFLIIPIRPVSAGGSPDLAAVVRVPPDAILERLDDPNLYLVDIRCFAGMFPPDKIPGAVFRDIEKIREWASDLPKDKEIILYGQ
jgi:rhodanese-related sulfurtransferase